MKKEMNLMLVIALMVVIAGGAFYGGTAYQKAQSAKQRTMTFGNRAGQTRGVASQPGQFTQGANRPVAGQILSADSKSITVKMRDGSSRIVLFGSNMTVSKSATGAISDLTKDAQVMATGTQNKDGSVTATSIQIEPAPTAAPPAGQ